MIPKQCLLLPTILIETEKHSHTPLPRNRSETSGNIHQCLNQVLKKTLTERLVLSKAQTVITKFKKPQSKQTSPPHPISTPLLFLYTPLLLLPPRPSFSITPSPLLFYDQPHSIINLYNFPLLLLLLHFPFNLRRRRCRSLRSWRRRNDVQSSWRGRNSRSSWWWTWLRLGVQELIRS